MLPVADRVVAPVVPQAPVHEVLVVHEEVDRHKLDRRHPETFQVVYGRGRGQAGVRAAQRRRDVRVPLRKPLDVGLVDYGVVPGNARRPVVSPGEGRLHHLALGHARGVVPLVEGQILLFGAEPVAEVRVTPVQVTDRGLGVGVEQQLVRVEAVALFGVVGSVDPVAVELAEPPVGQVAVPLLVGALPHLDALDLCLARRVEEAELDLLGVLGEEGEVDPLPVPGRPERVRLSRPDDALLLTQRSNSSMGGSFLLGFSKESKT
jgi:hypothetical protein